MNKGKQQIKGSIFLEIGITLFGLYYIYRCLLLAGKVRIEHDKQKPAKSFHFDILGLQNSSMKMTLLTLITKKNFLMCSL